MPILLFNKFGRRHDFYNDEIYIWREYQDMTELISINSLSSFKLFEDSGHNEQLVYLYKIGIISADLLEVLCDI